MDWIRAHVFTPFYKQARSTQTRLVLVLVLLALAVAYLLALNLQEGASMVVLGTDPAWNMVQRFQVILANLQGGLLFYPLGVALGIIGYKWWVRTATGRSSCSWSKTQEGIFKEPDIIRAAKTHNQGRLQAAWILGSLLFFGLVLR